MHRRYFWIFSTKGECGDGEGMLSGNPKKAGVYGFPSANFSD